MTTVRADRLQRSPATSRATPADPTETAGPATDPAARTRRRRQRRRSQLTAWAFIAPLAAYLAAFYLYPLYRNLDLSLHHYTVRSFVDNNAPFSGWANYSQVLHDPTFWPAMRNTMVFTLVSILLQYAAGLALAVFFNRGFRLSGTLRALFLVPWLLPLIVSSSTWAWMLNSESGVVNYGLHLAGIAPVDWLTYVVFGLVIVLILALITMWDSSAQQRAARYAATGDAAVAEDEGSERAEVPASGQVTATAFPVPPLDLPHYHGVGVSGDNETSSKEVTGA